MFDRVMGVSRVCAAMAAGLVLAGLSGCLGGGGSSGGAQSSTITQSSITLPSSVQVVSAH